jgi:HSP20 family protein
MNHTYSCHNHKTQDPFDRFLNQVFGSPIVKVVKSEMDAYRQGIFTNTFEEEDKYELHLTVPGFAKEDIKISINEGVLTIKGETKDAETQESPVKVHTKEWIKSKFSKSFTLPKDADITKISASQDAGVLKVIIGKVEKPKPQEINVL